MSRIILASKSPRRFELLSMLGFDIDIAVSGLDESAISADTPELLTKKLAETKARDVYAKLLPKDVPVVAADTLVEAEGKILGKPKHKDDAIGMLRLLSGKKHLVHTGLSIIYNGICHSLTETASVSFRELSDEEIYRYVDSGEPMDKAGAYGIQGPAGAFVERIEGDYFTIVGLPLCRLATVLQSYFDKNLYL